jgi:hypothetical protein
MVTKTGGNVPILITKKWDRKKIGSCFWIKVSIVDYLVKSHEFSNIKITDTKGKPGCQPTLWPQNLPLFPPTTDLVILLFH